MTKRRQLIAGAALLAPLSLALGNRQAVAQDVNKDKDPEKRPQFLFVQSAEGVSYVDGRLTLKAVSPITVIFSDRPDRLAGHMATEEFVLFWSEGAEGTDGADSFKANPPNADLTLLEKAKIENVVVELRDPKLEDQDLSYKVTVIEGELPEKAGPGSLFIDIIGRPLTPVSFAGARRRMWRRAAY